MDNRLRFIEPRDADFDGIYREYLEFALDRQLLSEKTWDDFVRVFLSDSDDADKGWRCEYWGKMMRGACLCYRATGNGELYGVLTKTVNHILKAQREDGRFSTYSEKAQLNGWDLWGRKYVMTGLMHYLEICTDDALKEHIVEALKAHADRVTETVGSDEGKAVITETSDFWGGVNSCSILEPFMSLYGITGEKRYLAFAEYILSTGGCRDGNIIKIAMDNEMPPYKYPEVKAYETMSFFEGVLEYYRVTEKEEYLRAVLNFFDAVVKTDLTVIGCSGCKHEQFDNSSVTQIIPSDKQMQETCVSVTWMRLCAKLLLLTGESRYYGFIERTGYNALYGAVNTNDLPMYSREKQSFLKGLPFDSYSPLVNNRRGIGIGGFKEFSFGGYYGCCACIASAGIALLPLTAVMRDADGLRINTMFSGSVSFKDACGKAVRLTAESSYPREGRMNIKIEPEGGSSKFKLMLLVTEDMKEVFVSTGWDGSKIPAKAGNYVCFDRVFSAGDTIDIEGTIPLVREELGDSVAFRYGNIVLARDEAKEEEYDTSAPDTDAELSYRELSPEEGEMIRIGLKDKAGRELLLTDYASCGKHWDKEKNKVTVWMKR